jgi:hypothetical protein
MDSRDKRGVVIGASQLKAQQILKEALTVPAPQSRSAYMPMKYRKIGPVPISVDVRPVPSGEKIASDEKFGRQKDTITAKWFINDRNVPKNSSSMCHTKLDNHTGERKVPIKDLTGLNGDAFTRLLNLL